VFFLKMNKLSIKNNLSIFETLPNKNYLNKTI
jgi:hypothetical protein